jgi:5-methylcytosine-specific restriction endonuclease McrA
MKTRSLAHVGDDDLLRGGIAAATHERGRTADLLVYIAEIDARKLYLREACHSMKDYCIRRMRLEADAASKRIQAARVAWRFPDIFDLVEDGRLHLAGVVLLAPHLTEGNAGELLAAAADRSKRQIEELIAVRFPRSEMLTLVQALPPAHSTAEQSSAQPGDVTQETMDVMGRSRSHAPGHADSTSPRPKVEPIASGRFALQVMIDRSTYEDLEYARALLGHQVPGGEIGEMLARALRALVGQLEKTRFAATRRPRANGACSSLHPRHIPRCVKRAVWERDGGQCTFTSEDGHRCTADTRLEWDHIAPVARGGQGTVENLRLVCRAHNRYLAERTFGEGFMSDKRRRRGDRHAAAAARVPRGRARRIAATCAPLADAPLEERLRFAIRQLAPPHRTVRAAS